MTDLSDMCSFTMMRINAFLDNELDDETADEVRMHLSSCEDCFEQAEIWTSIRSALKKAYAPGTAPQSLLDKVSSRIRQEDRGIG